MTARDEVTGWYWRDGGVNGGFHCLLFLDPEHPKDRRGHRKPQRSIELTAPTWRSLLVMLRRCGFEKGSIREQDVKVQIHIGSGHDLVWEAS